MARSVRTSAPGSIMVTGEHAVLYGYRAVVAAIVQRVHVTVTERKDANVRLTSDLAPPLEASLRDLPGSGPYRFVLAALRDVTAGRGQGVDIAIRSEIDPTLGLGSSAAVTVACLASLNAVRGTSTEGLHDTALRIVRRLQGRGSGADLAASLTGGVVAYRAPGQGAKRADITDLPRPPAALSLKYCGYKTPTGDVLRQVADRMALDDAKYTAFYADMGRSAEAAITGAEAGDWPSFYTELNAYQALMAKLGVSDETLDRIVAEARADPATLATKISGSGLGDCVLALGPVPQGFAPVELAETGLILDG